MAPASVGVAMPKKIVPSTRKMRTSGGTQAAKTLTIKRTPCRVRASGGSAGASDGGDRHEHPHHNAKPASTTPGKNAPRNRSPTDTPIWSPRITSTIDGGMIWPNVPEDAITPVASGLA
jgi:hypothetical protein